MALLTVDHLRTSFHTRHGVIKAVDDISFAIEPSETLGIVGESGSGKSVACYSLMGLVPSPPGKIEGGEARLAGFDLLNAPAAERRNYLGNRISIIFQDPMTALNPFMRIGKQVAEPLIHHGICAKRDAEGKVLKALGSVGLPQPEKIIKSYPHELSGGMRQRVMIAMALITEPDLVIADEPTTALDVRVQAQILARIKALQSQRNQRGHALSLLLITHNLGIVAGMCNRVAVMYAGRILEMGTTEEIFHKTAHPYTFALLRAIPSRASRKGELYSIPGQPPDLLHPSQGCPFAPRCEFAKEKCLLPVELKEVGEGHLTACLRVQEREIDLSVS